MEIKIERQFEYSWQEKIIDTLGMWIWERSLCPMCSIKALDEIIGH